MAIVPFNRGPRPPVDPLAGVSDAHKLMAIGQMYQDGSLFDPTPMNPPPPEAKPTPPPGATARSLKDFEKEMESNQEINSRKFDENATPAQMLQNISEKKNIESLPEMPGGGGGGGSSGGALRLNPAIVQEGRYALLKDADAIAGFAKKYNLSNEQIKALIDDNFSSPKYRAKTYNEFLQKAGK